MLSFVQRSFKTTKLFTGITYFHLAKNRSKTKRNNERKKDEGNTCIITFLSYHRSETEWGMNRTYHNI